MKLCNLNHLVIYFITIWELQDFQQDLPDFQGWFLPP